MPGGGSAAVPGTTPSAKGKPMITDTTDVPRVWIGCLNCYNNGRLVGAWFDCTDAGEVDIDMLHRGTGRQQASCEEIWCFDAENLPVNKEMPPTEAAAWGEVYDELDDPTQWPALRAWVSTGCHVETGDTGLPSVGDFHDRYRGSWADFGAFAADWADEIGLTQGWPEEAVRHFEWDSWTRDLAMDFTTADAPDGGIYVFANN